MLLSTDSNTQAASGQKTVSPLASLIEDGTITSDQEQAIKEALETARMAYQTQAGAANASGYDPLDSLVASGTITEDQKAAVKEALDSARDSQRMMMPPPPPPPQQNADSSDALISALDSLVEDGTITSEQQEYVMSAYESAIQAYSVQADSFTDLLLNSFETEV